MHFLPKLDNFSGMIVTCPGRKPAALRVDQLDRDQRDVRGENIIKYPEIVHFGARPPQMCYAGKPFENNNVVTDWCLLLSFRKRRVSESLAGIR